MTYTTGTIRWQGSRAPGLVRLDSILPEVITHSIQTDIPLVIVGKVGTGKTTLMREIDFWTKERHVTVTGAIRPWLDIANWWTDAEAFCDDVKAAYNYAKQFTDWSDQYSADGIAQRVRRLFLDDLGLEPATDTNLNSVTTLLRERLLQKNPTWITTNLSVPQLAARYGERLMSRLLEQNVVVILNNEDRRIQAGTVRL